MARPSPDPRLSEMARANRSLLRRARRTRCRCPSAVLNLGNSVASLATYAACVVELNRFLDEAVLDELLSARRRLADDLDLLETLSEASPDSPDSESLARALLDRIERLVEREDRVLYQPLLRLAVSDAGADALPLRRPRPQRAGGS